MEILEAVACKMETRWTDNRRTDAQTRWEKIPKNLREHHGLIHTDGPQTHISPNTTNTRNVHSPRTIQSALHTHAQAPLRETLDRHTHTHTGTYRTTDTGRPRGSGRPGGTQRWTPAAAR